MEPRYIQYLAQEKAAEAPVTTGGDDQSLIASFYPLIMLILIFLFLYFFTIRPQRKEEKRRQQLIASLKKGDVVITQAGIIGSVHSIKDDTIILRIGDNAKMEVLKSTIYDLRKPQPSQEQSTSNS
ncbi:MAG: preprotein translocase subunit YajC [Leptospiraceae bacterium]|nr:preprotein translocase subunit YajC [Leptospiraceae bacterium]MDW7975586.1 preprotein translocase subunit YajC [Leptospiraceae bacterium]